MKTSNYKCKLCDLYKDCQSVCIDAIGNTPCDIMIIKEFPSFEEDETDKHQDIDRLIGFISHDCYVTHAVSCRPVGDKNPKQSEMEACGRWLRKRIKMCEPQFVLLMGNIAVRAADIFPAEDNNGKRIKWKNITQRRGKIVEKDGIFYLPTYSIKEAKKDARKSSVIKADVEKFKLLIDHRGIPQDKGLNFSIVQDEHDGRKLLMKLKEAKEVSFDVETTGLYPWDEGSRIISMGFGFKDEQITFPINHPKWRCDDHFWWVQELLDDIDEIITDIKLIAHNGKFDSLWVRVMYGYKWDISFDTMLAHYLLDENDRHSLDHLSKIHCSAYDYDIPLEEKKGNGPLESHCAYLALDVYYTMELKKLFYTQLKKDKRVKRVFDKILMPCCNLFRDVEYRGFHINVEKFDEAEEFLKGEIKRFTEKLIEIYPHKEGEINWSSPKQVGEVLFDNLKLPVITKTPKGARGTGESVLKRIDHPITSAILNLRGANQQLSFFIEGWKPFMVGRRIHPSFKLHGTVTGRPSCERPNLQQVPRDPRIRSLICAPKGYQFVEFDLSQIEMRIAAELSGDLNLMETFLKDIDIHWKTAIREIERGYAYEKEVLETAKLELGVTCDYSEAIELLEKMGPDRCVDLWKGWKEVRKKAKAVNFGYLYGMWWKKFKQYAFDNYGVHVTDEEAEDSRIAYFELYPGLTEWHNRQKMYAKRHGYVQSLTGRKRRLPEATKAILYGRDNNFKAQEALRQSINSPVQCLASDWNLMTALQVAKEFPPPKVYLVGTVHDSILTEVKKPLVEKFDKRVREIMMAPRLLKQFKIQMKVPVKGDVEIGPWGTGVSLKKWKQSP